VSGRATDDMIADLVLALADEENARGSAREARARQAEALRALRAAGLRHGEIAHRVVRARGAVLPMEERLKLAERLRKRASRAQDPGRVGDHG
jgi:hypothetical protein